MKKEKKIRTYQRRTKSGKLVTVKAHTAKYDAAEKAKELAKKKGAGDELEERKKKKTEPVEVTADIEEYGEVPAHLGMTQQNWNDWMEGGDTYAKANRLAKKHLENIYGKKAAAHIIKKYEGDGSNTLIDAVSSSTPMKALVSEVTKLGIYEPTSTKTTRYASGAKLNEDGTFVSEKDYNKSIAHRKRKGARISPEEVKAIKKWESEEKVANAATKTTAKPTTSEPAFTAAEFKEWYQGTGSAADKKVAKALRAQLGRSGYRKLEDEAIDNYSARGHLSMFKRVSSDGGGSIPKTKDSKSNSVGVTESPKSSGAFNNEVSFYKNFPKELRKYLDPKNHSLEKKPTKAVETAFKKAGFGITYNSVEGLWEPTMGGKVYGEVDYAAKIKAERSKKPEVVRWAKENGYVVSRDGTYHLRADSRKSSYDVHTLSDMEKIMKASSKMKESAKNKDFKSGGNKVSSDLVKKYAHHEDISVKEARSELSAMSNKEFVKTKARFDKQPVPKSSAAVEREAERSLSKSADSRLSALKKSLSKEQVNRLKEVGLTPTTFAEKFGGSYSDGKFTRTERTQKGTRFTRKPVTKSLDAWIDIYKKTGSFELGGPIKKVPKSEATARKSKTKKSYTTAKRMKPSEVADMTTKRDWIYEG